MADSYVEVTEGSGKKLRSHTRTVNSQTVHEEVVLPAIPHHPSYIMFSDAVSMATANSRIATLHAGASLNVYVTRIRMWQVAVATTLSGVAIGLRRMTTAATGGTAVTPAPLDPSDPACGATARALATAGTFGTVLANDVVVLTNAYSAAQHPQLLLMDKTFGDGGLIKPLKIAAGTDNGIGIQAGGVAGATVIVEIQFFEAAY